MAIATYLTLTGIKLGLPSGTKMIGPAVTQLPNSVGETLDLLTVNGNNTIQVPTGSTGFILFPPAGNLVAITLKGIAGDTGVALHLTDPSKISLAAGVTSFVLNVAGAINLEIEWY